MVKKFKENFNFITNILILLTLVFGGLTYAVGFHIPDEIISGNFSNDYNFTGTINGIIPIGAVMAFNLASCPNGWIQSNGTGGTVDLRGEFIRGFDNGRGVDSGRIFGSFQNQTFIQDRLESSSGYIVITNGENLYSVNANTLVTTGSAIIGTTVFGVRPRNVALLYCQKN